jgi:proline iminopeptidase
MIKKLIFVFLLLITIDGIAQELYSKAFGNPKNTPLVFLHGGPGYNCAAFEVTTAQALADMGFYVIVYDRRGEGRSKDANAKFNFEQTFADLNAILEKYDIKKANLIGHSFGGIVAVLFAEKNLGKVSSVELVSAPVSLQETFKTILRSCKKIYTEKNDTTNLNYIGMIEKMDPSSVEYFAYSFGHAMQNGFYSPKKTSDQAKAIYASAASNPAFALAREMTNEAPAGFLKNENYTSIDLAKNLQKLVANKTKIYGIYGKDDGLYSPEQVAQLQQILGNANVKYWDDASHNVFIDQQKSFLDFLKTTVK